MNTMVGVSPVRAGDVLAGKFRVDGMNLTPVDAVPAPMPGIHSAGVHRYQAPLVMPGGWTAQFLDDNDVGLALKGQVPVCHPLRCG